MNTTEATYPTRLHEWLSSQHKFHALCIRVKVPGRKKNRPFDRCTACFRCVAKAS